MLGRPWSVSRDRRESVSKTSPAVYQALDEPLNATVEHEGSFAPQDACVPAGCLAAAATGDPPHQHRIPLGDELPSGVPVQVVANVTYEAAAFSSLDVDLEAESGTVYAEAHGSQLEGSLDGFQGRAWVRGLVVREDAGAVDLVVTAGFAEPPEQPYELDATLTADPATVPSRVPVAVEAPGEDPGLRVTADGAGEGADVRVWGPQGAIVARRSLADGEVWRPDLEPGEHVLAADAEAGHLRLAGPAEDPPGLRALGLEQRAGEGHDPGPADGSTSWEAPFDRAPYRAGLQLRFQEPTAWTEDLEAELAAPEGTVVTVNRSGTGCGVCTGTVTTTTWSDPLADELAAGTWTGTVEATANANVEVAHVVEVPRR